MNIKHFELLNEINNEFIVVDTFSIQLSRFKVFLVVFSKNNKLEQLSLWEIWNFDIL